MKEIGVARDVVMVDNALMGVVFGVEGVLVRLLTCMRSRDNCWG